MQSPGEGSPAASASFEGVPFLFFLTLNKFLFFNYNMEGFLAAVGRWSRGESFNSALDKQYTEFKCIRIFVNAAARRDGTSRLVTVATLR